MLAKTLQALMELKRMKQADLAKRAGISRQAVSKWFVKADATQDPEINAEWHTITKVAEALQVKPADLTKNLFQSLNEETRAHLEVALLWDELYDSVESFVVGLTKKEDKAVGRYVQVFGILAAEKIFGKWIYNKFDHYSSHLEPSKRKELRKLCQCFQKLHLT